MPNLKRKNTIVIKKKKLQITQIKKIHWKLKQIFKTYITAKPRLFEN